MSKERTASVKTLIKEAELANASGDFVYQFYIAQSKVDKDSQSDEVDEFTEQTLLKKNDPFIELTLAQYCFFPETLGTLFKKSKVEKSFPLTLACISNETVSGRRYAFVKQPEALFTGFQKEAIGVWFKTITKEELEALFRNPTIDDDFLTEVLEGKKYWSEMTDEQRRSILSALTSNSRVSTPYDDTFMDGWAEHSHGRVATAIWHLAATLPVERQWGAFLGRLLEKVVGGSHGMDMLEVAKRWNVVDPNEKLEKKKQFLNPFESVRYALYKGSGTIRDPHGKDRAEVRAQYFKADDLAYRAAVYSALALTQEEIASAYEKDALLAFQFIVDNLHVWKNPESRKALHDIGWDADGRYNNNYLDCANHYNWKEKELEAKYPGWFVDKEEESTTEVDETTQMLSVHLAKGLLADRSANPALEYAEHIHALVSNVVKEVRKLNWIFWGLVALLAYEIFRR